MMNSKISATSCWWFILKLELPDEWIQFSNATEKADGLTGDLDLPNLEMKLSSLITCNYYDFLN